MPFFFGNMTATLLYYFDTTNVNYSEIPPELVRAYLAYQVRYEVENLMKFGMGIVKSVGYPLGLLLQILTVIFLVRGNSGYSRSARRWFLIVLGADIGSTLYRAYELITVDFRMVLDLANINSPTYFGQNFLLLVWGLRDVSHAFLQRVICKVFFIIMYFPIHLSPIALTVSALIRCYCVKFPLRAKAKMTTRVDRTLMAITVAISLAISVIIGALVIDGWSNSVNRPNPFGIISVYYGDCVVPRFTWGSTDRGLLDIGNNFMLGVIFFICASNVLSAAVIILVLFESKRNRKSLSASDVADSKAEVRATAMLLGMNITLFVCFFVSRVMAIVSTKLDRTAQPVAYILLERLSMYLFNIPYYTNSLFIAGFSRKLYEFYMPCLANKETRVTSAVSQKTLEESKVG